MVEVGVTDDRVLDLDLLGNGERPPYRAGVDEDAVVNEEGRRPLTLPLAAECPEDLDLQCFLQSGRFTIARILVYQAFDRQGISTSPRGANRQLGSEGRPLHAPCLTRDSCGKIPA